MSDMGASSPTSILLYLVFIRAVTSFQSYIYYIPGDIPSITRLADFADDAAIISKHSDHRTTSGQLKEYLKKLQSGSRSGEFPSSFQN